MFTRDVTINAERKVTRRRFVKTAIAATAGLALDPPLPAAGEEAFSFVLLGDLHFDRLAHHDLDWLRREKPDDFRQVQNYSRLTAEILPRLFSTVRETVASLNRSPTTRVPFVLHDGDLVEGLCGSEKLAVQQDTEAIEFLRGAKLGAPFLFSKGHELWRTMELANAL